MDVLKSINVILETMLKLMGLWIGVLTIRNLNQTYFTNKKNKNKNKKNAPKKKHS